MYPVFLLAVYMMRIFGTFLLMPRQQCANLMPVTCIFENQIAEGSIIILLEFESYVIFLSIILNLRHFDILHSFTIAMALQRTACKARQSYKVSEPRKGLQSLAASQRTTEPHRGLQRIK